MPSSNIAQPHHRPGPFRARRRRGFTLVEILTATAIMALIISLVMTILTQVMSAWNLSTDQLTLSSESSEILNLMSQDLQGAVFKRDGNQWLYVGYEQPAPLVPSAVDSRLIFFAPTPLRATKPDQQGTTTNPLTVPGDLCAIEYRVEYADPFNVASIPQKVFSLHRVVIDPSTTFIGDGTNAPLLGLCTGNPVSGSKLLTDIFDNTFDSQNTTVKAPMTGAYSGNFMDIYGAQTTQSSLGLDNIAQFTVMLYYNGYSASTTSPIQIWPAYSTYTATQPTPPPGQWYAFGGEGTGATKSGDPKFLANSTASTFLSLAYADITLSLFTDEGLQIFESYNGSLPQDLNWNSFVQQYTKTFTRRVYFENQPQ
jgi:prepilin-type N-terminal cleavage/methylation domain-containing protein